MADWYVSSTNWASLAQFAASHVYALNDIIRPLSPSGTAQYALKCTTAGTSGSSQPSWSSHGTTPTGTAVFTNVTGQGWATPAGTVATVSNLSALNIAAGDRVFVSSDHTENVATNYQMSATKSLTPIKVISVNKAGSVPPADSDITSGAVITGTGSSNITFDAFCPTYWEGITFQSGAGYQFNSGGLNRHVFKNGSIVFNNATAGSVITTSDPTKIVLDNTTMQFGNASQHIQCATYGLELEWLNTSSAIVGATLPSTLLNNAVTFAGPIAAVFRGVDLSAITGTLVASATGSAGCRVLFDSCKINSSVTRYGTPTSNSAPMDEVELVNCFDGTNIINERYTPVGTLTTSTSTYMSSGATDDVGNFSHKMVTNSLATDAVAAPLESFWLDVENTVVGSSVTATVEIVSSASLNNTDIHMQLEYQGTSGSSVASFADSLPTPLTASSALSSSTATWNSPPSTPIYQKIQVTFTPEKAGRVRGRILLGKASTTVYVNPQMTIQ